MSRSTAAFSLLESLCMIVTLFVFGWLCVGVVRYELKHVDVNSPVGLQFTAGDKPQEPAKAPAPEAAKPKQEPAPTSKPAGSEATPPVK